MDKPKIIILATGGTIAGAAASSTDVTGYAAGTVPIENLLNSVPQLAEIAEISGEQIVNIGSQDMTETVWQQLALRVNELLAEKNIDGVVITHGTDTLEETAFFLHLTVHSDKPVVMVGAMRPSTSVSADGPMNLLNAVRVAASPLSRGKGVLVVMNDTIDCAREVTKTRSDNVAAFNSSTAGALGFITGCDVIYLRDSLRRHTLQSDFSAEAKLPRVDIVYSYAGADGVMVDAAMAAGASGIIHAGTGNGSIHMNTEPALIRARKRGAAIVRSSRIPGANTVQSLKKWSDMGFLNAGFLNPQKSRILLMLALTKTKDLRAIQKIFDEY